MLYYIKHYPISLIILAIICYLSFFTPPKTDLNEIPNLDKLVHFCMYFGFSSMIWIEYLWSHSSIRWKRIIPGAVLLPILISGLIEILQENCTDTRSGDWLDFLANCRCIGIYSGVSLHLPFPGMEIPQTEVYR